MISFILSTCGAVLSAVASSDAQCDAGNGCLQKMTADKTYDAGNGCLQKMTADNTYTWNAESMAEDVSVLLQHGHPLKVSVHTAKESAAVLQRNVEESRKVTAGAILEGAANAMQSIFSGGTSKETLEVVLARFNEDVAWSEPYKHIRTIYCKNKSKIVPGCAQQLPNVGREGHTFLYHIVNNYDRLAEWTVFSQAQDPTIGYQGHRLGGGHMMPGTTFDSYLLPEWAGGLPATDGARFVISGSVYMGNLNQSLRKHFRGAREKPSLHFAGACPMTVFGDGWEPWWDLHWYKSLIGGRCGIPAEDVPHYFLKYWDRYIKLPRPKNDVIFYTQGARFAASRERIRQRPKQDYQDLLELLSHDSDPCHNYFNEWVWYYIIGTPSEAPCDSGLVLQQASRTRR